MTQKWLKTQKKLISKNPLVEKAEAMKNKIEKEVANNKLVKKAEKMSSKLKKNISETIENVKDKIEDYTEDILDDVKEKVSAFTEPKNAPIKKVVAKKVPTKKKVVAKKLEIVEKVIVVKTDVINDLKIIKGIGPVLEKNLNELNITSYDQISKMTIEDLTKLLNGAGINAKIYDLEGWKAQATLALKGAL
jgi:predicted flap endonuclease-1-like 5' DNA nuclease